MFGYIMALPEKLTQEQRTRYGALYCGLCRSLKKRHGFLGRITLNYDMTFLILVLSSLYEPEEHQCCCRCMMHPMKKRPELQNSFTDYAADLNLLLAWWNAMDDWEDERKLSRRIYAALTARKVQKLEQQYPRQSRAIRDNLALLKQYEAGESVSADRAAACFGDLMGELFVWREDDYWAGTLREMGQGLGRFIYIMDACLDYEEDQRHDRPNPLRNLGQEVRTPEEDYDILTMLMGDCTRAFEILPLEQDLPLMRNILYAGAWQKYNQARGIKKEKATKKESTE